MNQKKLTIKNLEEVLTPEDKNFCDRLFKQYKDLQNRVDEFSKDGYRTFYEYNETYKDERNFFKWQSDKLASYITMISSTMEATTESLVTQMEGYFAEKYSVTFTSLLKSAPSEAGKLMPDYEAVIANMINETGLDFSQGKP